MAVIALPTPEMVALTRTWVDPEHQDHQVLLKRPATAGFMPEMNAAHALMLQLEDQTSAAKRLREIQREQETTDGRHDDVVRGIWYRLLSEEYLATDPDMATKFRSLRERILPQGLQTVRLSYREEIGHAEMVADQLEPSDEQFLRELATHDQDLHHTVEEWLGMADQLGVLDHERTTIESSRIPRGGNLVIRRRWARVVNLIRRAAELHPEDQGLTELMARVAKVDRQAEQRRARRASGDTDSDTVSGSDGDTVPDSDTMLSDVPGDVPPSPQAKSSTESTTTRR